MATVPIITFKAGTCEIDQSTKPFKVVPIPIPGYIYLYAEENLIHFCWRERSKPINHEDNLDLVILPSDCRFLPYESPTNQLTPPIDGRIFALKFSSSSQRYIFWMQSKPQVAGDPGRFSERDLRIGRVVDRLLQGEQLDISTEIKAIKQITSSGLDDEDETMEDVDEGPNDMSNHYGRGSGGAGPDATGGDIREEGASSREGGADGGRAAGSESIDAGTIVQNFLHSLQGQMSLPHKTRSFPSLQELLASTITVPIIESATPAQIDTLLSNLPPNILITPQDSVEESNPLNDPISDPSTSAATVAMRCLTVDQKKSILKRVLRSPQLHQSLGGLSTAIKGGGLPSISTALGVKVPNGGLIRGGNVPLGGDEAIEAFIVGIKENVEESNK
ncbi:hypothetical protein K3495_g221 [Podosphaera aphanis]|nr:hypothetical protein K3495_g221 [Podosphaera aphanis]